MEASGLLNTHGIKAAVVSLPCWELFDKQDQTYRKNVLGNAPKIAIEAGCDMGWSKYIGEAGLFIGMKSFGASGPADQLYNHFGITSDAIVKQAIALIK